MVTNDWSHKKQLLAWTQDTNFDFAIKAILVRNLTQKSNKVMLKLTFILSLPMYESFIFVLCNCINKLVSDR